MTTTETRSPLAQILNAYVRACPTTPGGDLQNQITQQARRLLDENHPLEAIIAAATACGTKGWRYLDRAMQDLANQRRAPTGQRRTGNVARDNCRRCQGGIWLQRINDDGSFTLTGKCDHTPLTDDERRRVPTNPYADLVCTNLDDTENPDDTMRARKLARELLAATKTVEDAL